MLAVLPVGFSWPIEPATLSRLTSGVSPVIYGEVAAPETQRVAPHCAVGRLKRWLRQGVFFAPYSVVTRFVSAVVVFVFVIGNGPWEVCWPAGSLLCAQQQATAGVAKPRVPPDHAQKAQEGLKLFREEVAGLLEQHCLKCHGGQTVKGQLDMSTRESLLASGMVGESAAESHLFAVINHAEQPAMPKDGPKLPETAIAKIGRWLDLGAPYDRPLGRAAGTEGQLASGVSPEERNFWSFRPLVAGAPPAIEDVWVRTDIDRFILAKLREKKLRPNPCADRYVLIRRAYLDLLGVPPTPEAVEAFVSDPDPDAYEKLIDSLLASPHYGERWARHWMDIARFAESHGYEQDYDRPYAYHYRDFLIRAFNADMPYDQFVRWQIAGDELAPHDPLAMMATGFLGAGAFPTQLTEAEFESARYDELDDMANTLGTAILGLTIGCARCHEHKYDPIPLIDYYRFIANFTTTIRSEIELDLDPEGNAERRATYERQLEEARRQLKVYQEGELTGAFQKWLASTENFDQFWPWQVVQLEGVRSSGGSVYRALDDGSWLAEGTAPAQDTLSMEWSGLEGTFASIRLETLTHSSLPKDGPGRAANGNFAIGDIRLWLMEGESARPVELVRPRATHEQDKDRLSIAASLDNDPVSGWAVDQGGIGKDQAAVFDFGQPIQLQPHMRLRLELVCRHPNGQHIPGRVRLSLTRQAGRVAEVGNQITAELRQAIVELKHNLDTKHPRYAQALAWFAQTQPRYRELHEMVEKLEKAGPPVQLTKVQVTSEGLPHMKHHADERGFPHFYPETYVLHRGDVHQKKQVAVPGFLQVLMRDGYDERHWQVAKPEGWTRTSFRRASLAQWLMDVEYGAGNLAARVIVNRLWQHHFGRGIVATPSDFGAQGERPTHPELLEWLAADLVHHGWRLKRLHKLIMTSAVYMQSGDYDEERARWDRENQFYWRFAPRRLEAEPIRDSMLAVAGLLDTTMYGPGTLDVNMKRRSIYFFIKRSQLIPMMMLFDWPEHLVGIGQRPTTTIAPQALALLNSPQCRQWSQAFAQRVLARPAGQRIGYAYLCAWGRPASQEQRRRAEQFLAAQTDRHRQAGHADAELFAWTDFCQALFGANGFLYIE